MVTGLGLGFIGFGSIFFFLLLYLLYFGKKSRVHPASYLLTMPTDGGGEGLRP